MALEPDEIAEVRFSDDGLTGTVRVKVVTDGGSLRIGSQDGLLVEEDQASELIWSSSTSGARSAQLREVIREAQDDLLTMLGVRTEENIGAETGDWRTTGTILADAAVHAIERAVAEGRMREVRKMNDSKGVES